MIINSIKNTLSVALILFTFCTYGQQQANPTYGDNKHAGAYKQINGVNLYYEIYGAGKPLILLHGNGGSIRGQSRRIEYFKNYFKVIVVDSRGHGKSAYPANKPLTYEMMAADINTLMDSLHIDSAFIWGQSDGGILGLLMAIKYPAKVSRVAGFGANLFPGKKAIADELDNMVIDSLKSTKNERVKQLYSLLAYQPNITEKELNKIKCPVLVMSGDRDAIKLAHTIKIFENIPNANLFIMPGASHFGAYEKPELFNMVLLDFFTKSFSKVSTVDIMLGHR
ncbi:alpha/beta fold hydrolase [Chryseosolibacter indicus]|uniref:Alpha/beta hydrolase n=1 Tax=Chryseosolibacter indicus TaxID=2782351 RepID=A0ABS5VKE0_9BACT|nr:alpha/beta hydrolase [Chryseosolibacter indicus]MBT1701913.1 alpha/beta hydrolase [Chryseosolibacter indicus]